MQDSPTTLIFIAILLPVLHTGIAAYLLMRNAYKMADWPIRLHRAVLGQFAVFVVALFFTAGFVAAIRVVSLLGTVETILVTPVLFLLLCWIGQDRMISYLATYHGRRKFLQKWKLRRIGVSTMVKMIFYYICVSLVALGAITYQEWTKQNVETPTTQKLSMGIYTGNIRPTETGALALIQQPREWQHALNVVRTRQSGMHEAERRATIDYWHG